MQCKEFLNNQLKELINIKTNLITKKISNILNIIGHKIIKEFGLNKSEVESIINEEIDSLKILEKIEDNNLETNNNNTKELENNKDKVED